MNACQHPRSRAFAIVSALALALPSATTAIAQTATYNGPNTTTNGNTWMTASNWLPAGVGVPAGPVNVVIPAGKTAAAWDDTTPVYTGNLSLGTNARLQMGWDDRIRPASFNALGTPGTTLITLAEGALINSRSASSFEMPEILLSGNAGVSLGTSTQVPSEGVFNYPINGPFEFNLRTNSNGGGAKLNAPNTFTSMVIQGVSGRGQDMFPFAANVPGALGLGNVTTTGTDTYTRTPQIQFNAPNVMRPTARLILNGRGPSGNGNNRILMNQSATVGGLVIDGVEQAPGVYTNSEPWLAGPGTLTVLLISPLNPDPAFGKVVPFGDVQLTWTNEAPTTGTDVWSDVWFGTDPNNLTKLASKQLNLTTFTVTVPAVATTHYWRVDSYLDGDPDGTPKTGGLYHFIVADTTGDGIADAWKAQYFGPDWQNNPDAAASADPDNDGLTNLQEFLIGTIPTNPDTDGDGLLDGWETNTGTWVSATDTGTDPLKPDTDGDGLLDGWETNTGVWASATNTGTDPNDWDSDGDGLSDGVETNTGTFVSATNTGTNPNNPDTDGDGAGDWYEIFATLTDPTDAASTPGVPYPLPAYDGSPGVSNKPVKVYILAGQSNMVGFGAVYGSAPGTLATMTQRENKFPHLLAPGGGYVTRNDVHYRGVVSAIGNGPLRPGFGRDGGSIGPELGFGQLMGWYHDEPVLIIKASIGNRSLLWDILPVGSERFDWTDGRTYAGYGDQTQSWTTGTTPTPGSWYAGKEFDRFFLAKENWAPAGATDNTESTGFVLDNFATQYPQWAAQGFEIAGFGWFQGFGDQGSPSRDKYEENMVRKIKYLRSYYENRYNNDDSDLTQVVPNAPYAIATFAVGGFDQGTGAAAVAQAQLNVDGDSGNYPEFAGNVKTMEARHYWRTREQSPNAENFHYYWNSETYMLVGDALARAIIEMQDDETPPTPNPMTFEVAPQGAGAGAIGMRATLASDQSLPVEYNFWNTTNETFRGWSTSREWTETGLTNGATYSYRVKARDANGLEGEWSAELSASAGADTTAPTPNPMTFAVLPTALGETSITMTATTATDLTAVEYFFANTQGGGPDSGWQSSTVFTPTGLNHSTTYAYTVRARDAAGNETTASAPASATTASPDLTAPTPNPMIFASPPAPAGLTAITMTATTASDPSGVEYYFEATDGGNDSGWQDATVYTDTGLSPDTTYSYRVRARDKAPAQNTTAWSATLPATTDAPDLTPPTIVSLSPTNGATGIAVSTNLVITFNESVKKGTGNIVIRNAEGAAVESIAIGSASVVVGGAGVTITPSAPLEGGETFHVEIDHGAILDLADNAFIGISGSATWSFTTSVPGAVVTYTGSNGAWNNDRWGTAANWNSGDGPIPSGNVDVEISSGKIASVARRYRDPLVDTPIYDGSLTLRTNSQVLIAGGTTAAATDFRALGTGPVTMEAGSSITFRVNITQDFMHPIILAGNATLGLGSSSDGNWVQRTWSGPISGPHRLTVSYSNGNRLTLTNPNNSFSGGLLLAPNNRSNMLRGTATGAFGTGDVTNPGNASITFDAVNVMAAGATLHLSGTKPADFTHMLFVNQNQTIEGFILNGTPLASGTYNSASGLTDSGGNPLITGSASITVTGGPPPAPTLLTIEDDQDGEPVEIGTPVTYTLTFDKAMDFSTFSTSDFGNAGTAAFDTGTFSQVTPEVFTVEVTPTTAGSLQFRVNQGADIRDTENVALDTTAAILDDTIITVTEPPATGNPFDDWAGTFDDLTDPDPARDFDNGGLATALEWVLGGDPTDPSDDAGLAPTIDNKTDPDGKLLFIFRRSVEAAADENTTITVQYGNTLSGWTAATHQGTGVNDITFSTEATGDEGIEMVTVALPATLAGQTGKLFVRLHVVIDPG